MDKSIPVRTLILALALAILPAAALAQERLSLEHAAARSAPNYAPARLGERISVSGVVSAPMYRVDGTFLIPIQDQSAHGLMLSGSSDQMGSLAPGDIVDAVGTVSVRLGMPVLVLSVISRVGAGPAPTPLRLPVEGVRSFANIGILVTTESFVNSVSTGNDGDLAAIGDRGTSLQILLPRTHRSAIGLAYLSPGDRIRVTGTLIQADYQPPFDDGFHILISDASGISTIEKRTFMPPQLLVSALAAASLMLIIWWIRERRMANQRRSMKMLHALSEEIIAAQTPADLAKRLAGVLPEVTAATAVRLYLFNTRTRSLERVVSSVHPEPVAFALDSPPPGMPTGVAVCFRNRRLLSVPDTRRSPFLKASARSDMPRAAIFVPMFAHQELLGVLELSRQDSPHFFTQEEQASAQHIGNQVAAALKLQEQQTIREQLFRSEKLAATGQLISGVASELRTPLSTILQLANSISAEQTGGASRDMRALAAEARHASEIVSRLVSFARPEDSGAQAVEVNHLLLSLIEFRAPEWQKQGLHIHNRLSPDLIFVHGAQGQLEQVFLNLLIHAEQCTELSVQSGEKAISVASSLIARRVLVEIGFPSLPNGADPLADSANGGGNSAATGLAVCRGILQTHGGEIYFRTRGATSKFEVELPIESARTTGASSEPAKRSRPMTILVVDSESAAQRLMVSLLSSRGHRVVPVSSHQEAVDLVQRLKFDCVFFAARAATHNWMEMFDRVRIHTPAIVLLTDGFDPELHRTGTENLALARPVQDADLDQVLEEASARSETPRIATARDR